MMGGLSRRGVGVRVVALIVLTGLMYLPGLTAQGLTNWQESQRALVARQMFNRGDWLVPMASGELYLAKPPMMYWVEMVIGRMRGRDAFTDETEVRLAVALAGMLGVIVTYLAARSLLRDERTGAAGEEAALWSAAGLAVGVLYVRSSRIGELDILLVPSVVVGIWAVIHAWRASLAGQPTAWGVVAGATIASVAAALTKGPPGLALIAVGGYGPIVVRAMVTRADGERRTAMIVGAIVGAMVGGIGSVPQVDSVKGAVGAAIIIVIGALIGGGVARLVRIERARVLWLGLSRTHPLLVLGVPVAALWGWLALVQMRAGGTAVSQLAQREVVGNTIALFPESPVNNLGFIAYGGAPISIAAVLGAVWLVRKRVELGAGRLAVVTWCGLGFVVFSVLGKGVARYLTPLWPGIAMLGGLWLAHWLSRRPAREATRARLVLAIVVGVAGAGQTWWYGAGRATLYGDRSPRAFVRELLPQIDASRMGTWEIASPAIDYYVGEHVEVWTPWLERRPDAAGGIEGLIATVRADPRPYTLVLRAEDSRVRARWGSVLGSLEEAGIAVKPIELGAPFATRRREAPVIAVSLAKLGG